MCDVRITLNMLLENQVFIAKHLEIRVFKKIVMKRII